MISMPWYKPKTRKPRRKVDEMGYWDMVKKLDKEFSDYVRMGTAVKQGYPILTCYTCGSRHHWKDMDNGHFIGREYTGTRWHMSNTRPQCKKCNRFAEGEKSRFALHLIEDGIDIQALQDIANIHGKSHMPTEWLLAEIKEYRRINKQIAQSIKELES